MAAEPRRSLPADCPHSGSVRARGSLRSGLSGCRASPPSPTFLRRKRAAPADALPRRSAENGGGGMRSQKPVASSSSSSQERGWGLEGDQRPQRESACLPSWPRAAPGRTHRSVPPSVRGRETGEPSSCYGRPTACRRGRDRPEAAGSLPKTNTRGGRRSHRRSSGSARRAPGTARAGASHPGFRPRGVG